MKFSVAISATLLASIANAAVVTQYVQVTKNIYEKAHVLLNSAGDAVATSYELVSTEDSAPTSIPVHHDHSDNQPAVIQLTTSSPPPAPTTTSTTTTSTSSSPPPPPPTTSSPPPPPPTTTSSPPPPPTTTSSPPPPPTTTSSAPSSSSSSSGSSSSDSGEFSGDATFYSPGMGSCGTSSSDSDFIAALNAPQMGSSGNPNANPNCGKKANVYRNGKSVTVTVVDKCPSCSFGSLDLSPAAFNEIADPSEGRVEITWSWA